ncbi:hypothetical protein ABB37_09497 [Leptomonas pyrrhocoris]|uniref:BAR domain-containing protein n=1 Tax=Leptomonas pyrrhocoris TaxID=157538 RepID=A0A0N0DR38_LEPPY|nr:hypothetical protein ABB37_09497 [Leptomonas pyrrhocoris]XP_015652310.1 hypothetical protein ABB37_09497 [Leptomonas pyrrhocoris]XP_015652311.1 hypothetical protein ABB37_09497 [Leptomonas pyrrhocoris]KPA73870.1 hypothetical protein ABB37_09497 [Leptomonas pyrrhocoris]KPA73871.1 hypothetical protein ABB37_09497 [Leptomonas pyrrhocoris]KPA73872.1 hypothetical protein ABB37_09497 [Leptomonas pyrrhocoris]|eukprot:XP_015652309.1 hypothetical protein ABB37_09497 [Leptomonas pyrrhocoris]
MSYVVEYAKSVHSAFRAPNNFCHDLQHVMRGAVKNLSQTCLLTTEPQQLARYQAIFTSLQNIIDTNTTMSECTVEQSDTFSMMDSTGDYLAAASSASELSSGQQPRRLSISTSSVKSSKTAQEVTSDSFDAVGAENLSAVLSTELVRQLGEVYDTAAIIQKKEAQLHALKPKVKKYASQKKAEKLLVAHKAEDALNVELAQYKGDLQEALTECFPAVYKRILQEYIDLCNSLLRATLVGTNIIEQGTSDAATPTNGDAAHQRIPSVALTVDVLEAHEALEEMKREAQHRLEDDKTREQKLRHKSNLLNATAPPTANEAEHAKTHPSVPMSTITDVPSIQDAGVPSGPSHAAPAVAPAQTALLKSPTASTVAPLEASHTGLPTTTRSSVPTESLSSTSGPAGGSSRAEGAAGKTKEPSSSTRSSTRPNEDGGVTAAHAEESVAPSLAGVVHQQFPFWFRYYYFDRLANSTERLAIAFCLYLSYCRRLARSAGYAIPPAIKKHMDRVETESTTARYARHKREFQAVLKEIFTYRKNLEVMETYVRLARDAETHVNKYAGTKNKDAYAKWSARLTKANDSIELLRVEVFGRGAEEMIRFYDQLLLCIRSSVSDFIVTLGGTPEA